MTKFKMEKNKIVPYFIWLILFLIVSFVLFNCRLYSYRFVDENHHVVIGSMMNKKINIYKDLSTNHQPIPFIASYIIETFLSPTGIRELIIYNRSFIFLYSLIWYSILLVFFGKAIVFFSFLFEMIKYNYLGNLLLAESLAVYPLVFLLAIAVNLNEKNGITKLYTLKSFVCGLALFLVFFNLAWLWPLLIFWTFYVFIKDKKFIFSALLFFLTLVSLLFVFISPVHWFRETIFNVLRYTIPAFNSKGSVTNLRSLFSLAFPLVDLFGFRIGNIYLLIILGLILYIFVIEKFQAKSYWVFIVFLFLANIRMHNLGEFYYEGFHILPWLGSFLFLASIFISKHIVRVKYKKLYAMIILTILISGVSQINKYFSTNKHLEYIINYSEIEDLNWAIINLSSNIKEGKMFVTDITPLVYYKTGLIPIARQVDYYPWQESVPSLNNLVKSELETNEALFLVGLNQIDVMPNFYKYRKDHYQQLLKEDKTTKIGINRIVLDSIESEVWMNMSVRGFSL